MTTRKASRRLLLVAVTAAGLAITDRAVGQDFSLNYERLSSLEEPVATEIGDVTLVLNGLLDTALIHDADDGGNAGAGLTANLQVSALTQLSNRWRVGLRYFGQYVADDTADGGSDDDYTDNAALTVGGAWGSVLGGNVSGAIREQTRRLRGAGNASWRSTMCVADSRSEAWAISAASGHGWSAPWWTKTGISISGECTSARPAPGTIG